MTKTKFLDFSFSIYSIQGNSNIFISLKLGIKQYETYKAEFPEVFFNLGLKYVQILNINRIFLQYKNTVRKAQIIYAQENRALR